MERVEGSDRGQFRDRQRRHGGDQFLLLTRTVDEGKRPQVSPHSLQEKVEPSIAAGINIIFGLFLLPSNPI